MLYNKKMAQSRAGKAKKHYLWDYDYDELKKTEKGRIFILERMINYGPEEGEKIKLANVKKYWAKLDLYEPQRELLEYLVWGKVKSHSSPKSKNYFGYNRAGRIFALK